MVEFNKEKHEYRKNGQLYESVTKVISHYCQPFESAYWGTYKGIKDILTEKMGEDAWWRYKKAAGSWEKVVDYYRKNGHKLHKEIAERKAQYLKSWDVTAHNARVAGSAVHKWKERQIRNDNGFEPKGNLVSLPNVSGEQLLSLQDFKEDKVYPELVISNDEFRVAGTADKVRKEGNLVYISDYKTSKKITKDPFMDRMMKNPLNTLPDTNYWHFTIQFSLYGWMLEQLGYRVVSLTLEQLIPPKFEDKDTIKHEIGYRPDLVEVMLKHFRNKK